MAKALRQSFLVLNTTRAFEISFLLIWETYMFSPNKVLKELEIRYKWIDLRSYEDGIVPTTRKRDIDDACSKIIKVLRHGNNNLHLVIYPSTANPIYYKSHDIIVTAINIAESTTA